jgi:acyl-CoA thioester hydrolase
VEINYRKSAVFDDVIEIAAWLDWVRGASMRIDYELTCDSTCVATASTVHAMVDNEGRARRIPKAQAENLKALALRPGLKAP